MGCGSSSVEDETKIKEVVDKPPVVEKEKGKKGKQNKKKGKNHRNSVQTLPKSKSDVKRELAADEVLEYEESYSTTYSGSSYTYTKNT